MSRIPKPLSPYQLEWLSRYSIDTVQGKVFNAKGDEVGCPCTKGYIRIQVVSNPNPEARLVKRCHIIWWAATGSWPTQEIDHENRNKGDDRFENLRLTDPSGQAINTARSDNRDLPVGVTIAPAMWSKPYRAKYGKQFLGLFATPEEASEAYQKAKASR